MSRHTESPDVIAMERCNICGHMVPALNMLIHQVANCSARAGSTSNEPPNGGNDTIVIEDEIALMPALEQSHSPRRQRPHQDRRQTDDRDLISVTDVVDLSCDTPDSNSHRWACPQCTLWNPRNEQRCNACMYHNHDISAVASAKASADQPMRPADMTRTEQLLNHDFANQLQPPPSPISFVSGGAILGGLIGSAGALLQGRPVGGAIFEGALTGAVGGAMVHGSLVSPAGTQRPNSTNIDNSHVTSTRSSAAYGYPAYPSMERNAARTQRAQPRPSIRVISTTSGGRGVTFLQRSNAPTIRIAGPANENPLMAFLTANASNRGEGLNIDSMSYEQLLATFGDGSENRGTDEGVISQLPSKTITCVEKELPPAVRECSICLDAFVVGCSRKTLPCLHGFHEECIDRWLRTNGSCPICKHTVK